MPVAGSFGSFFQQYDGPLVSLFPVLVLREHYLFSESYINTSPSSTIGVSKLLVKTFPVPSP